MFKITKYKLKRRMAGEDVKGKIYKFLAYIMLYIALKLIALQTVNHYVKDINIPLYAIIFVDIVALIIFILVKKAGPFLMTIYVYLYAYIISEDELRALLIKGEANPLKIIEEYEKQIKLF